MQKSFILLIIGASVLTLSSYAKTPNYHVDDNGVHIKGVDGSNPIIYDNDWWKDIFDDYYLWAQASLGNADLRGNVVTRDMWEHPDYLYKMEQCLEDCKKAIALARKSGLSNIPDPTLGSSLALKRPKSGKINDTQSHDSAGCQLIINEAKKASKKKPLVIVAGGPLTTIANALLIEPSIADHIIVFSLTTSNYGYNGKDGWSAYIVAKKTYLVEWAVGSFWDKNSVLKPKDFNQLPNNPLCQSLQDFIQTDLGQANQMGDGSALVWMYNNACWQEAEPLEAFFQGPAVIYKKGDQNDVLNIPKNKTNLKRMNKEFFRVMTNPKVYAE